MRWFQSDWHLKSVRNPWLVLFDTSKIQRSIYIDFCGVSPVLHHPWLRYFHLWNCDIWPFRSSHFSIFQLLSHKMLICHRKSWLLETSTVIKGPDFEGGRISRKIYCHVQRGLILSIGYFWGCVTKRKQQSIRTSRSCPERGGCNCTNLWVTIFSHQSLGGLLNNAYS